MSDKVTIGGPRLGSGKKMDTAMHGYSRANFNQSEVLRTTLAPGVLLPVYRNIGLPGDTIDIGIDLDMITLPTVGPLYGSFKVQIDFFKADFRLLQPQLQMNRQNIGRNMKAIYLPQIVLTAEGRLDPFVPFDNQQINPSCILSHMDIRGLGHSLSGADETIARSFNASELLFYWMTYGQYYCNKQEEIGYVIHKDPNTPVPVSNGAGYVSEIEGTFPISIPGLPEAAFEVTVRPTDRLQILFTSGIDANTTADQVIIKMNVEGAEYDVPLTDLFNQITISDETGTSGTIYATEPKPQWLPPNLLTPIEIVSMSFLEGGDTDFDAEPQLYSFPLENLDLVRDEWMAYVAAAPYEITESTLPPYGYLCQKQDGGTRYSKQFAQEGLAIKTYQSDIYNNYLNQEWIDGTNGVKELSAIDVSGGALYMDDLNMQEKIYNVLVRISLSDGTYDAWQRAVYDHHRSTQATSPIYIGGLQEELVFAEVVSNAASENQPLGTLAGRGVISGHRRKGGKVVAKFDEPGMVYAIMSLTPRIDYSQGNAWHTTLDNMDEFHKPALDAIGYQDLITDRMAWWDTAVDGNSGIPVYKSAGKQPAWLDYQTAVNRVRGAFAEQNSQMFMVLTRRYESGWNGNTTIPSIRDLTTYIDPVKFNHIFADTRRDAQNFQVQIKFDVDARRKMSAKIIPNL